MTSMKRKMRYEETMNKIWIEWVIVWFDEEHDDVCKGAQSQRG